MQVSLFKNINSKVARENADIFEWLVLTSPATATKESTQCCTPHGTFTGGRKVENLTRHSGYAFLDIDKKDNLHIANFAALKPELCKLPEVAYCATSFSGNGYHLLVRLASPTKHEAHYRALLHAFKSLGINCDPSCINVNRLKIQSKDPQPFINRKAKTFYGLIEKDPQIGLKRHTIDYDANLQTANAIVEAIEAQQADFAPDYEQYIKTAFALANGCDEAGREIFHRACQFSEKYDREHADRQFDDALTNGSGQITFASFVQRGQLYIDFN